MKRRLGIIFGVTSLVLLAIMILRGFWLGGGGVFFFVSLTTLAGGLSLGGLIISIQHKKKILLGIILNSLALLIVIFFLVSWLDIQTKADRQRAYDRNTGLCESMGGRCIASCEAGEIKNIGVDCSKTLRCCLNLSDT